MEGMEASRQASHFVMRVWVGGVVVLGSAICVTVAPTSLAASVLCLSPRGSDDAEEMCGIGCAGLRMMLFAFLSLRLHKT